MGISSTGGLHRTRQQFTREMTGTANAIVAGWGNLGGGVAQIVMGSVMLPLFKILLTVHGEEDDTSSYERAWRTVCILPEITTIGVGWVVMIHSEDAPRGNYKDLKRSGWMPEVS